VPDGADLHLPRGVTASTRDVTERVRLEEELRRQAGTDALTGLANRQAFIALLEERLRGRGAVVLFCDLDGFKTINDTDGHATGDAVLRRAGRLLAGTLLPGDVAARLGGDEFAVLLGSEVDEGTSGRAGLLLARGIHLADHLVEQLAQAMPAVPGGRSGVSIGVAAGSSSAALSSPAEALLRDADLAMYEAKARGGGRVVVFEEAMRERVLERTRRQAALERAISGRGLQLHLQPLVNLQDGCRVGFEALVRWQDGDRLRGPGEFVPLAEETGLILPLGTWVLRSALHWLATWPDRGVGVSVNVAGRQVADPRFGDIVRAALHDSGVDPGRLTLEITEQTAVDDLTRAGAALQPLRALGVHVALDDFGTGFSSLGYLARLPVDELKIDRRFVSGLGVRSEDEALVRAVIGLAGDLGLRVVAEGVETPEQAAHLRSLGCPWVQGYLYGRPVPLREVTLSPGPVPALPPVRPLRAVPSPGGQARTLA
jgi:diguanylate cyclase (GGDEF)-like protein